MKIAVHITHESVKKTGGIGAVLNGMATTRAYNRFFDRTVLYGPLFGPPETIFPGLGEGVEIIFSSLESSSRTGHTRVLGEIAHKYGVDIVFGRRKLLGEFDANLQSEVDLFLIGVERLNSVEVARFKYVLWEKFGLQSELYEGNWDYEEYLRIAVPFLDLIERFYGADDVYYLFAHEYMGVASALSAVARGRRHKTIFVAHEVSTARSLTESLQGHDVTFYNILRKTKKGMRLEDVFGSQEHNPRNELIKRAVYFDRIFAVSDLIKDEYLFLVPDAPLNKLRVVYNGLPLKTISPQEKSVSREKIDRYINTLLNFVPDVIFTRVTRLVISKGLWRDIMLLYYLDELFAAHNLKGAYLLLSTLIANGRSSQDILKMEENYGWPVMHRVGWPDLEGAEVDIYNYLQVFNSRSRAIKAVFINQLGFDMTRCGSRVPEGMEFADLRIASDAEFGFSIYEPFGIAQLEVVPFGGVSLLSSSCGSTYFLRKVFQDAKVKPFYIVDFISAGSKLEYDQLIGLSTKKRNDIERELFKAEVQKIFGVLPVNGKKRHQYLENAQEHIQLMGWEQVVKNYLLPSLST